MSIIKEGEKIKHLKEIDGIPLKEIAKIWDLYNVQKWEYIKECTLTQEIKNLIKYAFRMSMKEEK